MRTRVLLEAQHWRDKVSFLLVVGVALGVGDHVVDKRLQREDGHRPLTKKGNLIFIFLTAPKEFPSSAKEVK